VASSPDNAAVAPGILDPASQFRQSLKDLDDRLKRGEPFSGHERNCAFLNTGAARWATVSHLSGFDFDDDARALACTDWDGDGDLDVWVANRTAPMVRYLRNDTPRAGAVLTLQLLQDTGNRHAIGARVTVKLKNNAAMLREVRAGDSYLSQSSQRLHFGLGPKAEITAVTVRWPGGPVESFTGLTPNTAWLLRKGAGRAIPLPARSAGAKLQPGAVTLPPGEIPVAVPLAHPLPVPRIEFTELSGKPRRLDEFSGTPVFLTLVSAEQEACAAQFSAWQPRLDELKKSGLRILAAGMDETRETRGLLDALPPGIERGLLPANARERLAALYNQPFEMELRLSAPVGFSLDRRLRLLTVYRGDVSVEQLLADVQRASFTADQLTASALPFAGRWFRAPAPWAPLELLSVMLRQSDWSAAHDFMTTHREEFKKSRRHAAAAKVLADALIAQNLAARALPHYQDCLAEFTSDPVVQNNLAHCLLHATPHPDAVAVNAALGHAQEAVKLTARRDASLLDTLAHALRAAGRKEDAGSVARDALKLPNIAPDVRRSLEQIAGISK
jgi:hypothetical protein